MTAQPATLPPHVVQAGPTVADVAELKEMLAELEALTAALPEDDGRPVETLRHHTQMVLLRRSLIRAWRDRQDFFVGVKKKDLYEQTFRTTEYFVWDPFDPNQFQGWRLVSEHYQPIEADERGWQWSEVLEFWLGPWEGTYVQDQAMGLRLYDADGQLVLTTEEAAEEQAKAAEERAEAAEAEAARLRARLAELEEGSEA